MLVSNGDARIVLDLGPGTLAELFDHVRPHEVTGIVLSHMHQDHWLDLIPLRYRLKYAPGAGGASIPLHLPPGGKAVLDAIAGVFSEDGDQAAFFRDVFDISEYEPLAGIDSGGLPITFAPSVHPLPCWMMRVHHDSGDLGYTADTGANPKASDFLQDVRCLVVEATWMKPGPPGSHLTAFEAGQLAADCHAGETVLTHLWAENGAVELLDAATGVYRGSVHLAYPGLAIAWP